MYQGFNYQRYLLRKKVLALLGKWSLYDPLGNTVFYCEQKWSLKMDIRIYSNESKQNEVLSAKRRQMVSLGFCIFDIWDPVTNEKIGVLEREGVRSLMRDGWIIMDKNNKKIGVIREDSVFFALLRRFFLGWLFPKKYFGFIGQSPVCIFRKHFNPFIWKTSIDFSQDINNLLDRRIGIAAAIILCAVGERAE